MSEFLPKLNDAARSGQDAHVRRRAGCDARHRSRHVSVRDVEQLCRPGSIGRRGRRSAATRLRARRREGIHDARRRGPFPTELFDEVGDQLARVGNEYGSVTGRPRRCGWFDRPVCGASIEINGITGLCLTKLDVLDGLDTVRSRGLQGAAASAAILPVGADALSICAPIYEELPGWKESNEGVKKFADLPKNAQTYLRRLEVLVGAPIAIISTGAERARDDHPANIPSTSRCFFSRASGRRRSAADSDRCARRDAACH